MEGKPNTRRRNAKTAIPGVGQAIAKRKRTQKRCRTILSFDVGCRNLAFCVLKELGNGAHDSETSSDASEPKSQPLLELQRWEVVDVLTLAGSRARNVRNIRIENLVRYMLRALPMLFTDENMVDVTDVLIEQQIRRGIKNVVLSYILMGFFESKFPRLEKKVHLIGSKEKFRIIEHSIPDVVMQEIKDGKRPTGKSKKAQGARYRSNKRLGKAAIAKELQKDYLLVTDDIAATFKGGKRDDLADCLLQALVQTHPDLDVIPEEVGCTFAEDEDSELGESSGDVESLEPVDPERCSN